MPGDSPDDRDPALANAYAIAYRLLGERSLATAVAQEAATATRAGEVSGGGSGVELSAIAGAAVDASLRCAEDHAAELDSVSDAADRSELRKRFTAAPSTQRRAAALVHLGGYGREDVAELLGVGTEQVDLWCAPFDPPPGSSWADLGDPSLRGARGAAERRSPLARIPRFYWILAAVVLAFGLWAATSVGQRPSIEPSSGAPHSTGGSPTVEGAPPTLERGEKTEPDRSGTSFSSVAPVLPSAGCRSSGGESGAAPLLVLVGDARTPADEVAESSGLVDLTEGWVHVPAEAPGIDGDGLLGLLENTIEEKCVDLDRVFAVGFGEGGRVAGEGACTAPQLLTGIVMVAGWVEPGCSPDPRVAVLAVGSQDDPSVDTGTALQELGTAWAEALGAGPMTVDGRDEETLARTWTGPGGVTVETVATVSGGHTWTPAASLTVGPFLNSTARSLG